MSSKQREVCSGEVRNLIEKGAIVQVDASTPSFLSSLFAVPKKPDGFRPILNLRELSGFVAHNHFKLEHLIQARFLLKRNDWLAKVDLKDAYLSFTASSSTHKFFSFFLPDDKIVKLKKKCRDVLSKACVSTREMSSLLGSLNWTSGTIKFAQAHFRSLQRSQITALGGQSVSDTSFARLSLSDRADIHWWMNNMGSANGIPIDEGDPDVTICSDASLSGWGAVCGSQRARGVWSDAQSCLHINELELLAALNALNAFACDKNGVTVHIYVDNVTALSYINKRGGTRSPRLNAAAQKIVAFCEERQLALTAFYIPGKGNTEADAESRARPDASDYMLNRSLFRKLAGKWHMETDLFASQWNAQLPDFVTWRPEPGAMAVDAFSLNWRELKAFAFPPFSLIHRCLSKVVRERASLVLIAPIWPSQTWFPLLAGLACDHPVRLPNLKDLLISADGTPHPLLISGGLNLAAWRLSGDCSRREAFRSQLWHCWNEQSDPRPEPLKRWRGDAGNAGAETVASLPFQDL